VDDLRLNALLGNIQRTKLRMEDVSGSLARTDAMAVLNLATKAIHFFRLLQNLENQVPAPSPEEYMSEVRAWLRANLDV